MTIDGRLSLMNTKTDRGQAALGVLLAAVVVAVLVILGIVGWQFGWWLDAKNEEKAAAVRDNAPNAQRGYVQAARDSIEVVLDPTSPVALVKYHTEVACDNLENVNDAYMTPELEQFQSVYC